MNGETVHIGWLLLALFLILVAAAFWFWSRGQRERAGLPSGQIIYEDSGSRQSVAEPLYAPDLQLTGRPDYLIEEADGSLIPVEVKSGKAPREPHEGHIFQLAVYCLLVEDNYGQRPAYGIIQYRDRSFAVDYTYELEDDLLDILAEMRADLYEDDPDRDHHDWQRCAHCGVRGDCYQRLA